MTQDINENRGQCTQSGDIHNRGPVTTLDISELRGSCAGRDIRNRGQMNSTGDISGGLNLIGNQGEIHFHVTLASAEMMAALVELLKLASAAKQSPAC